MPQYRCFVNGKHYGQGTLEQIQAMFAEYVIQCNMNGRECCEFKITRIWNI